MYRIWDTLTQPLGIWSFQQRTKSSEKAIKDYYENIDRSTVSRELVNVLGKLVESDKHPRDIFRRDAVCDENGVLYWEEDSFKKWVTTNQRLSILSGFVPTLWRVFVYFARFPFAELVLSGFEGRAPQHQRIDEDGFVLAYNLLALRGVELLGGTKSGWSPKGGIEKSWSEKYPRLVSLMFNGFKIPPTELDERFQDLAEKQLVDAIVLTQPEPYMTGSPSELELGEVAKRVLTDNVVPIYDKSSFFAVSKHDLQTFIQLCLLMRVENAPWKSGLVLYHPTKRSSDIDKPAFVDNQEELLLSARLAEGFDPKHALETSILLPGNPLKPSPNIVLRFYELWTAICVANPKNTSSQNLGSGLSNCVVQSLSLIGPTEFDCGVPGGSPFNEDERQLQLDMQNATLVADSTSTLAIDEPRLVERLTNVKWFHILILSTEEAPETAGTVGTERLITLFAGPQDEVIWFENTPGLTRYTWRYGIVQLLPHIFYV